MVEPHFEKKCFKGFFSALVTLIILLVIAKPTACIHSTSLNKRYQIHLSLSTSPNYELFWSLEKQDGGFKFIKFAVNVSTTGWVGFGLSLTGNMPGSDVVIGWVDSNGHVFM